MALCTPDEYRARVQRRERTVYINGHKVENLLDNPNTKSVVDATARVYELALEPENEAIMTATSHLTGEKINRNLHVNRSNHDLEARAEMALLCGRKLGTCNYRCVGCDAINALASVTWEMDQREGTHYHARLTDFLREAQAHDWACTGALTDAKGDRSERMLEGDPDMFVHMTERRHDGITVRGAKLHQSGAIATDYTLVMPGQACRQGEEDYAVAFAVPSGSKGLTYISQYTPMSCEREHAEDQLELGNPVYGQRETCIMIFDDVFIPRELVFMEGEVPYAGKAVARFAKMHRMNCGGACKVGFADLIIGATQLMAEYLGTEKAPHIQTIITNMVRNAETAHACAIAAAVKGAEEPPGSGVYLPDELFGNVAKSNIAPGFWEIMASAGEVAGGLVVTMPSFRDLKNPETGQYVEKYLKAKMPAEKRMRITKFLQHWTCGLHGPGTWHGAGSAQAQMIALMRATNLEEKKRLANELAGIRD